MAAKPISVHLGLGLKQTSRSRFKLKLFCQYKNAPLRQLQSTTYRIRCQVKKRLVAWYIIKMACFFGADHLLMLLRMELATGGGLNRLQDTASVAHLST